MTLTRDIIAHNTVFYTGGLIVQKLISFFYFIIIARFLGAEDIGKYVLALSITTILLIIIDSGISPAITRETARSHSTPRIFLTGIILYKVIASIFVYAFAAVLVHILGYPELIRELVYLAGIVMILDTFSLTFYAVLRGLHVLKYESLALPVYQAIVLVVGLGGLYLGARVHILMVALIIASTFNTAFSYYWVKKRTEFYFESNDYLRLFREFMKYALPFAVTAVFIKLHYTGDTVLLSLLSTERELGLYSVAHKFVFALEFIPLAFVATLFPALSAYFKNDRNLMEHLFQKSSLYLMIIAAPIVFGGYVIAEPLTFSLYGEEFAVSASSLAILLLGTFFLFLNYPLSSFLGAIQRQKTNMYLIGTAVLISIVLNVIFIPLYAGPGSAFAFFASSLLLFILYIIAVTHILHIRLKLYFTQLAKIITIAFVMGAAVYFLLPYVHWVFAVVLGACIYSVLIFAMKVIKMSDVRDITTSLLNTKGGT